MKRMSASMNICKTGKTAGFTIVELMIALVVMVITASAIGAVIVDSQKSWGNLYSSINADVVADGYAAKNKFDSIVRKASSEKIDIDSGKQWVKVYYYLNDSSTSPDAYAKFCVENGDLMVKYYLCSTGVTFDYQTICSNVSSCTFEQKGCSLQMILKLDDGTKTNTVITSAVLNN
jgi:hypothetical protein